MSQIRTANTQTRHAVGGPLYLIVPLVATALIVLLLACSSDTETPVPVSGTSPPPPPPAPVSLIEASAAVLVQSAEASGRSAAVEGPQEGGTPFDVGLEDPGDSGAYAFSPSEMTFKVGETVNFTLTSETEFHTFTVDDLDIDASVDEGQTIVISFTFDEAGTFDLICIPHLGNGMLGTITVQ